MTQHVMFRATSPRRNGPSVTLRVMGYLERLRSSAFSRS